MNVASYVMWKVEGHEDEFDAYKEMIGVSRGTLKANLKGLDAISVCTGVGTWREMLYAWFRDIREMVGHGCNVVLMGSDMALLKPFDYPWDTDHMVMPMRVGCGYTGHWPTKVPQDYRGSAGAFFPTCMERDLFLIPESIWKELLSEPGIDRGVHDPDQAAWNLMYHAQRGVDFEADVGTMGMPAVGHDERKGEFFRHYSGSRGPANAVSAMRRDLGI
jgi:hypothetical protein